SDWYQADTYANSESRNPLGPSTSHDPQEPGIPKRVQRGGSFLCHDGYCRRYVPGGRGKGDIESGTNHIGFRCVMDPPSE
ncbi:formylglycine-generating enzyme family protein, partial [bacterium]|nr:formylglycine-generating enzyme family protein [bacterium]